jgi:hypothetical protein
MLGDITLPANPTPAADMAITRQYLDDELAGFSPMAEPSAGGAHGRTSAGTWVRAVAVAGDTMTGNLQVTGANITNTGGFISVDNPVGTSNEIRGTRGGVLRWSIALGNMVAEAWPTTGSNLNIIGYDNNGANSAGVLTAMRDGSTTWGGVATFNAGTISSGTMHIDGFQPLSTDGNHWSNAFNLNRLAGNNGSVRLHQWNNPLGTFGNPGFQLGLAVAVANARATFQMNGENSFDANLWIGAAGSIAYSAITGSTHANINDYAQNEVPRWRIYLGDEFFAQDFAVERFDNAGVAQARPLRIRRADGLIIMPELPTANPGVSGALWNNGGVLNVSP